MQWQFVDVYPVMKHLCVSAHADFSQHENFLMHFDDEMEYQSHNLVLTQKMANERSTLLLHRFIASLSLEELSKKDL